MAVPAVVAAELAKRAPAEVAKLRAKARRIGELAAEQFGLTEDAEYIGWKLLMLLGWELWELKLKGPVTTAYHIEQQLAGVLDQAYHFLGGTGSALNAGLKSIENATGISQAVAGAEWVFSHL